MSLFIQLSEDLVPAGYKIVSYDFVINKNHRFEASLTITKTKRKAFLPHEVAKIFVDAGYDIVFFSICDQCLKYTITPDC